jgi:hypothetical protein
MRVRLTVDFHIADGNEEFLAAVLFRGNRLEDLVERARNDATHVVQLGRTFAFAFHREALAV